MGRARHFCHRQRQGIRRRVWAPALHHATSDSVVKFGATIQADRSKYPSLPLTVKSISPTASRTPRSLSGTLAVPLKFAGGWATERSPESRR